MKLASKLTFAVCAALLATTCARADTEKVGGYTWTYEKLSTAVTISSVSPSPTGALTVPAQLGGMSVFRLGGVFDGCTGLTSVKLPSGLEDIGGFTFYGCAGLTSVSIPEGVFCIGYKAFSGCADLDSITLPDSLCMLGEDAFLGCSEALFDTTTIPGVALVDGWAVYSDCASLSGVLDLAGVRGIADYAFQGCQGITGVKIPSGVTAIGGSAFDNCPDLKSVWIPKSVTMIYQYGFGDSFKNIVFYVESGDTERVKELLFYSVYGSDPEEGMGNFNPQIVESGATCKLTLKSVNTKYGTVSGSGKYKPGKRVTIKAKAKSGYVFAGWYTDKACKKALNPSGYDNRKPTVKIKMPSKSTTIYANFVSKAKDKKKLGITSATKKRAKTAAKAKVGKKFTLKLGIKSYSLTTVTAKGLPKGLTIDKTSGVISGTPKKSGSSTVTVTVKTAAGNKIKFKVKVKVTRS